MMANVSYSQLFKALPMPAVIVLPDAHGFSIVDVNEAFLSITKTERDAVVSTDAAEVFELMRTAIMPDSRVDFIGVIHEACNTMSTQNVPSLPCNGTQFSEIFGYEGYFDFNCFPCLDEHDGIEFLLVTLNDVTDQELIRQKNQENETRLKTAHQIARLGFWELDLTTNDLFWSEEIYSIWELDSSKNPDYDLFHSSIHPLDIEHFDIEQKLAIHGEKELDVEHRIIMPDGRIKWVHERGKRDVDQHGVPFKFSGTVQDITTRKDEELRLKLYESAISNATDAIMITEGVISDDTGPKITYVNRAFTEMTGYEAEDVIGKTPGFLHGPRTDKNDLNRLQDAIVAAEGFETLLLNYKKDGTEYWVKFTITPVFDSLGNLSHWVSIQHDVSKQKMDEYIYTMLTEVGKIFNRSANLKDSLNEILHILAKRESFFMSEIWLLNRDKTRITLYAHNGSLSESHDYYDTKQCIRKFRIGNGLPGEVWEKSERLMWHSSDLHQHSIWNKTFIDLGVKSAVGFPLKHFDDFIGVLVVGVDDDHGINESLVTTLETFGAFMASEIRRKVSEDDMERLFQFAPDIIAITGFDGFFKKVNRAASNLLEYSEVELLTHPITHFLHPDDSKNTLEIIDLLGNGETVSYFENRFITKSGRIIWLAWTANLLHDDGLMYGVAKNITDKKLAESQLIQLLDEKNTILESIGDGFMALDADFYVTHWNNQAELLLGRKREDAVGFHIWELYPDAVNTPFYDFYNTAMTEQTIQHFESYYDTLDRWFEVSAYPSKKGLSLFFRDVTERREFDESLRKLNRDLEISVKELAISNAELEQFAYVASHDLQEPLRMVTSFLTQLDRKYGKLLDDKARNYIYFAVDGAKRMRQIILDLLEYSRIGRTDDEIEDVDTSAIIDEVKMLYHRQITDEHAKVNYGNMPIIRSYVAPVRQVFQNLIDNGLKYHQVGIPAIVDISSEETPTHWKFQVKDNGIGINSDYLEKIFIIFQRLHTKDDYAGTGIGLAITKKIVENLGGTITISSEEGVGSTITFTIRK